MPTEQEQITQLQSDMMDVKIRLGIAEGDISVIKDTLKKIDVNISKILWGTLGTLGTLVIAIVVALLNYFLSRSGLK